MTTKIKAVRCPQCGSEKHTQTGEKRFLCKNCGTEFFLDDDDININVNHRFDFGGSTDTVQGLGKVAKAGVLAFIIPLVFIILVVGTTVLSTSRRASDMGKDSVSVSEDAGYLFPVKVDGKMCFFYLVDRSYRVGYNEDGSKYTDGYYYGFRDALSGKVLSEGLLVSEEEAKKFAMFSFSQSNALFPSGTPLVYGGAGSFHLRDRPEDAEREGCIGDAL